MKDIHIGHEIEERLHIIHMTKTEFARLMGIPQQNVNRIISGKHISTDKLQLISDILRFDFFSLYQEDRGDIQVIANGDSSIAALNSEVSTHDVTLLTERVAYLERLLAEKERMIQYLLSDGRHDIQH